MWTVISSDCWSVVINRTDFLMSQLMNGTAAASVSIKALKALVSISIIRCALEWRVTKLLGLYLALADYSCKCLFLTCHGHVM